MSILSSTQIAESLTKLPGWQLKDNQLEQSFSFKDFAEALRFVNAVAAAAENAGHHPDIDIRYNKVRLALSSHDAGGITGSDTALAATINNLR